ncbi:MAG TPA: pyrroline-5-carboxylate reductase [Epsilonproteobacteria bacterium]|nr:pyrroline-5-carboxylate reductase [Campylobacterota bacterium]
METITFIGNGNMALSIAKGLKQNYTLEVVGRDMKKLETFEALLQIPVKKYLMQDFDMTGKTVILCVKPNNIESVSPQLQGKAALLLSVLAGTTLEKLNHCFDAVATVRTMPNLAAGVGKSMTTLTGDATVKTQAIALMSSVGSTLWLESEKELDIATGLAGSGPAYLALIAEALADGAVQQGLKREYAMEVTKGLFEGFGVLIQEMHPALLKDGVMSPGGTTAAGYNALEEGNVRAACMKAVTKAYEKAKALQH